MLSESVQFYRFTNDAELKLRVRDCVSWRSEMHRPFHEDIGMSNNKGRRIIAIIIIGVIENFRNTSLAQLPTGVLV